VERRTDGRLRQRRRRRVGDRGGGRTAGHVGCVPQQAADDAATRPTCSPPAVAAVLKYAITCNTCWQHYYDRLASRYTGRSQRQSRAGSCRTPINGPIFNERTGHAYTTECALLRTQYSAVFPTSLTANKGILEAAAESQIHAWAWQRTR